MVTKIALFFGVWVESPIFYLSFYILWSTKRSPKKAACFHRVTANMKMIKTQIDPERAQRNPFLTSNMILTQPQLSKAPA